MLVLVGLGIGRDARAGGKVDWSEYLETPGSSKLPKHTSNTRPKAAATENKASATATKRDSAKSKAKAKPTARSKGRRH